MAEDKKRIVLPNDQQTTIGVGFARKGKTGVETGDVLSVASSAGSILNAKYNPDTHVIDVVPIEEATGDADVMLTVTLPDGTVLPSQSVGYSVVRPDHQDLVLKPGGLVAKKTKIVVPLPNPDPHVVPEPAPKAEKKPDANGEKKEGSTADPTKAKT